MAAVILDTNVVIYLLEGKLENPIVADEICISVITEIELLGFSGLNADSEKAIVEFLRLIRRIPIDESVVKETIRLRRETNLRLPDALIAATALVEDAELVTCDQSLAKTPSLKVQVPPLK